MTERIRVIVADDHTIVRSGVCLLLTAEEDIDVVGEALTGKEALALAEKLQPNVVLMDISMPEMDGLEATRLIKDQYPKVQVLILTMHRSDEYFYEILRAGASGYIQKGARTNELIDAVRIVSRGEVYLNPQMTQKLVQGYLNLAGWENMQATPLSPREIEILRLLAEGYTNKEIADKLVISTSTVHSHRSNLMTKLELNTPRELIQYARQHGLLSE